MAGITDIETGEIHLSASRRRGTINASLLACASFGLAALVAVIVLDQPHLPSGTALLCARGHTRGGLHGARVPCDTSRATRPPIWRDNQPRRHRLTQPYQRHNALLGRDRGVRHGHRHQRRGQRKPIRRGQGRAPRRPVLLHRGHAPRRSPVETRSAQGRSTKLCATAQRATHAETQRLADLRRTLTKTLPRPPIPYCALHIVIILLTP